MNNKNNFSDNEITQGLVDGDSDVFDYLKNKYFQIALDVAKADNGFEEVAQELLACVLTRIVDKFKKVNEQNNKAEKDNKPIIDLNELYDSTFTKDKFKERCKNTWRARKASKLIINGIIVNDPGTWKMLYDYFYPRAKKMVLQNSGSEHEVKDLLQDTFLDLLEKCWNSLLPCDVNILAYIMAMLKNKWIDILRKRGTIIIEDLNDNHKIEDTLSNDIDEIPFKDKFFKDLEKLLNKELENMKIEYNIEDFLDISSLNDKIAGMIKTILNEEKTSETCRKVILLDSYLPYSKTIYLPDTRNEFIAKLLGYANTQTLAVTKSRCLEKLRTYFNK